MKKKIISNTIIFVLIIAFISGFSALFGESNTLVGVGIATIALVLVERDLTIHPIRNTIKLLVINLALGLFSYVSHMNMWLAVPLNFIALFFIGYVFSYNLRKSTVVPFGLLYLFMLYTPIGEELILERVLALVVGTIIIMIFQIIFNKNRFSKVGIKSTKGVYENIILKIESMKSGNDTLEINKKIDAGIKAVKKIILDKRVKDFYLTESADILTQVIWTLERISISLDELKSESTKPEYIVFLDKLLVSFNSITTDEFEEHILYEQFKQSSIEDKFLIELDELLIDLKIDMENVSQSDNKRVKQDSDDIRIPYHFNKLLDFKRDFSVSSLRFSFAIRLASAITIGAFVTQLFDLSEGRWMIYTIFALIQPYSENCTTKAKQRVQGTIIGTLIVLISFAFIKGTGGRFAIILLSGYLNPFFSNYRDAAVTFTISAVASAALMGGTTKFIIARISFVLLGTLIALLAIEDRMHLLNFGVNCQEESEFITNRRVLINNIYKHYTSLKKESGKKEDIYEMISELENSLDEQSKERRKQ